MSVPNTAFRMLVLCFYSEGELEYIKRKDDRFLVYTAGMSRRFCMKAEGVRSGFKILERFGYIREVTYESGSVRFTINPPPWLTLKEDYDPEFCAAIPAARRI